MKRGVPGVFRGHPPVVRTDALVSVFDAPHRVRGLPVRLEPFPVPVHTPRRTVHGRGESGFDQGRDRLIVQEGFLGRVPPVQVSLDVGGARVPGLETPEVAVGRLQVEHPGIDGPLVEHLVGRPDLLLDHRGAVHLEDARVCCGSVDQLGQDPLQLDEVLHGPAGGRKEFLVPRLLRVEAQDHAPQHHLVEVVHHAAEKIGKQVRRQEGDETRHVPQGDPEDLDVQDLPVGHPDEGIVQGTALDHRQRRGGKPQDPEQLPDRRGLDGPGQGGLGNGPAQSLAGNGVRHVGHLARGEAAQVLPLHLPVRVHVSGRGQRVVVVPLVHGHENVPVGHHVVSGTAGGQGRVGRGKGQVRGQPGGGLRLEGG